MTQKRAKNKSLKGEEGTYNYSPFFKTYHLVKVVVAEHDPNVGITVVNKEDHDFRACCFRVASIKGGSEQSEEALRYVENCIREHKTIEVKEIKKIYKHGLSCIGNIVPSDACVFS